MLRQIQTKLFDTHQRGALQNNQRALQNNIDHAIYVTSCIFESRD
jgi:hypothetical protein